MTASDQKRRSVAELSGASLDYAIELLTFAATDYSKTNLKPSAEEYLFVAELVNLGLLKGESVRDANGALTGILAGEITVEGAKFLADLKAKKKSTLSNSDGFTVLRWLAAQFVQPKVRSNFKR